MTLSDLPQKPACKIVYVIGSLNVGGAERHVVDIAPAMSALGYRVTVYCLTERGALADALVAAGVEVIGPPRDMAAASGKLPRYFAFGLSVLGFFSLLLRRRPAIVHCFLPMANIVGVALARLSFIPAVIATRRSLNRYRDRNPLYGRIEARVNRYADVIVSNSEAGKRELVGEGLPAARIQVIPNGIPLSLVPNPLDRSELRKRLDIEQDALVFVIVANLIGYKGHLDLMAALAGIATSLPPDWLLLVVGRDDGLGSSILQAARAAKIDHHVRMLGPRNDVLELLQVADIAVLSSHEEGFPTSVLEYMAAGLPVVATDVGGTAEAVREGETGYLAPAHDPSALGAALLRLAGERDERHRLGAAGLTRVRERFTLDRCIKAYDRLYTQLTVSSR